MVSIFSVIAHTSGPALINRCLCALECCSPPSSVEQPHKLIVKAAYYNHVYVPCLTATSRGHSNYYSSDGGNQMK